ncbi:ribonuclease 3-like protein 3 [Dioscorea cayenensis subsp. rotundata]|uniref:Ribonuclease 3-like protein 3 n=1 Tax=Dioscorea cayennensis subsp. rotundata TaxID=55577 RepID=A0AB40BG85_DIOCR|nr:ribonuclease 3-like protein 3 [Dioscorea cayenensis subsp. rotundata]
MTLEEMELVKEIEAIMAYKFKDSKLVIEALTHSSFYYPCKSAATYERLEFIGDAVLNCLVAREVFVSYPDFAPGLLTRLRAANVDTEKLARVAVSHELYRFIRHKAPQLDKQIQEFRESLLDYPIHSNGLLDPPKALADVVESLLGAVFIDSNSSLETVWEVYRRLAEPLINPKTLGKHPVSELHELCQKNRMEVRFLREKWDESTCIDVMVDGNMVASATYGNKKEIALNRAAKAAVDCLKNMLANENPLSLTQTDLFS